MTMATEYKLSYTAVEIDEKLGTVEANKSNIESLQEALSEKANESSLKTLESNIETIGKEVDANATNITNLQTSVGNKADKSSVTSLQNSVNTNTNTISGLRTDINTNATNITNLQTSVDNKADKSSVTTLQNSVTSLQSSVSTNANAISDLQTDIKNMANNSVIESINTKVDTNANSITTINQSLNAITDTYVRKNAVILKVAGSTDDTKAFTDILNANDANGKPLHRTVFVSGGTYTISDTLVIRENCELELSQDTVLNFTQTSGNCIEMRGSATLRGNHATIIVPYALTGNVISMDTSQDGTDHNSIPPYLAAGSHMAKRQRFIYDINILKPDTNGICKSTDGKCNGTAIYMHCLGTASFRWMWAITMSGVRIAGGFSYGIRAYNIDKTGDYEDNAWNHDMRIEAVIENCEIGVALENCNGAHLAVTIQPHKTESGVKYAKHGVYLKDARFVDMIGSRIWDWNDKNTLWSADGQYQHIALVDNCRGLLLDDFLCSESSTYIRDLIYTNNTANFDTMSVLQESGSKGSVQEDYIKYFADVLATATDENGNVFEGKGYVKSGYSISSKGIVSANEYYGCTGFIPVKPGDTVYVHGIVLGAGDGSSNFGLYNSSFTLLANNNSANAGFQNGTSEYYRYTALDDGFKVVVAPNNNPSNAAYLRFSYLTNMVKDTPMVSINKEIRYTQADFLADTIKVNGEQVLLASPNGNIFSLVVDDNGTLSTKKYV